MHWFVVASQKEARIFIESSDPNRLQLIKTLTNSLGSEKKRSLVRKEAGHGVKSVGHLGSVRYSQVKRHDPHEEAVLQFAKEIAHFLNSEKQKNSFRTLTMVAEPHLIGKIKASLRSQVIDSVTKWIKKDLQKTPKKELADHLTLNLRTEKWPPSSNP